MEILALEERKPQEGTRLELDYLHGGEVVHQVGGQLGPRTLVDFEFVYIVESSIVYSSDSIDYTVPAGGFILGQPGTSETYYWDRQAKTLHSFFHFNIRSYPSDWPAPGEWPKVRTSLDSICVSLFREIIQQVYEHRDWPVVPPVPSVCRLAETLLDLFIVGYRRDATPFDRNRPAAVCHALRWMQVVVEETPSRKICLDEIATRANVSTKHLCRLFSQNLGYSPMRTFLLLKLHSSQSLLMRTNLNITEIAKRCGFDDPLYFSRSFSKAFGCSPTAFRKQLAKGEIAANLQLLPADLMPRIRW